MGGPLGIGLNIWSSTGSSGGAQPDGYDVFALAGQSNDEGRYGPINATLDPTDARILQYGFTSQVVALAADPLEHQDPVAGSVGFGMTFARTYLPTIAANRKVLLVPTAKGGTGFGDLSWTAGGTCDVPALVRINAAMTQGTGTNRFCGVLWHQGEYDTVMTQATYAANLDALIARWRASITGATATTPFVVGELLIGGASTGAGVAAALVATPSRNSYATFVPSIGMTDGGDGLHYDAPSERTFGSRYYTAWQQAVANAKTSANLTAPLITGTPTEGQTLSCSTGTWTNTPTSYAYQWLRNGVAIGSATSSTYVLVTADVGTTITCSVTPTNAAGAGTAASANNVTPIFAAGVYDSDVQAWDTAQQAAGGTAFTATFLTQASALVAGHKADGDYTGFTRYAILAAPNTFAAHIYINAPAATAMVDIGAPTFTASRGIAGNASTTGVNSNFVPSVDGGATFTQNNMSFGCYLNAGTDTATSAVFAMGVQVGSGVAVSLNPRMAGSNLQGKVCSSTLTDLGQTLAPATRLGLSVLSRQNSTTAEGSRNGQDAGSVASTSAALPNLAAHICGINASGSFTLGINNRVAFFYFGRYFNAAARARISYRLTNFLTTIGAN